MQHKKKILAALAALLTALVAWLISMLGGCAFSIKNGDLEAEFLWPRARQQWNVTIDPDPGPTTKPALHLDP